MEKEKKIRIQMYLSPSTLNKLNEIQQRLDTGNRTATFAVVVSQFHKREFPDYIGVQRTRLAVDPFEKEKTRAQAKAIGLEELAKQKEQIETNKMTAICLALDEAEVTADPETGRPVCKFPTFIGVQGGKVDKSYVTHPLSLMSLDMKENQYQTIVGERGPEAKEKILALIKKNGLA